MIIQMLAGVYGHNVNGRVLAIRAGDPPIEVPDAIGARLVKAGVAAELVDEVPEGVTVSGSYDARTGEFTDEDDPGEVDFPRYNADMTRAELEAIGAEVGLDPEELKEAKNKAAIIALLDKAKADFDELCAEDEAPDIDPAAAIL